jgi:hypothetical protein
VLRPWQKRGERVVATSVPKNAHPLEKAKQGKPIVAKGKKVRNILGTTIHSVISMLFSLYSEL